MKTRTPEGELRWDQVDKNKTPLAKLAQLYISTCRTEGKTAKTLRGYNEKLSRFVRWLDGTLGDLSPETVRQYIIHLQAATKWDGHPFRPNKTAGLSPQTVANHVRILKGFATWLFEEGYTEENILARLQPPKAATKVIEILTEEEIARLLSSMDADTATGCRDLAVVVLLLDTGLRRAEVSSLRLEDVHFEDQWLKVMGKGQKERIVPFGLRAGRVLTRYVTFFRPDSPRPELFLTLDGEPFNENAIGLLFGRLSKKSGISRLHPHLLRHTFATSYLVAGGNVFALQQILGHSTLEMTRRYVAMASSFVAVQHSRFSPMDLMDIGVLKSRRGHPSHRAQRPGASGRDRLATAPNGGVRGWPAPGTKPT